MNIPFWRPGTPFLGPPGRHRTAGLWRWAVPLALWSHQRCNPCLEVAWPAGTPSNCLWMHTPPAHKEGLWRGGGTHQQDEEWGLLLFSLPQGIHFTSDLKAKETCVLICVSQTLTVLCADSQQVYDVLVLVHHLHQLHFRDKVSQVFVCSVI